MFEHDLTQNLRFLRHIIEERLSGLAFQAGSSLVDEPARVARRQRLRELTTMLGELDRELASRAAQQPR